MTDLLIKKVEQLYDWLDEQIEANVDGDCCLACGDCCRFEKFGHRIYITPPEVIFLREKLKPCEIKPATNGRCPYQVDNKCSIRKYRFGPCRIFFCKADADFQSQLSEKFIKKMKLLCEEFDIEYKYQDMQSTG